MNKPQPAPRLSRGTFLRSIALALPFASTVTYGQTTPQPAPAEGTVDLGNLRAFVELARSDIRTQKAFILAQNIEFTEDEAVEFWPVHREYETELNKLMDERYALIVEFAKNYGAMTNERARQLAQNVFDLENKRTNLKRKYFKKFTKLVPALKAARFFQIENQLNMAIDLQIAGALPLIK